MLMLYSPIIDTLHPSTLLLPLLVALRAIVPHNPLSTNNLSLLAFHQK